MNSSMRVIHHAPFIEIRGVAQRVAELQIETSQNVYAVRLWPSRQKQYLINWTVLTGRQEREMWKGLYVKHLLEAYEACRPVLFDYVQGGEWMPVVDAVNSFNETRQAATRQGASA